MIYVGSKNRLSKYLVPIIQKYITKDVNGYVEFFVGGANIIDKIECNNKIGYDIDKYTIACLIALRDGWQPPLIVNKDFYYNVKNNFNKYSDELIGYIGYELSFGAKWFGGYVKRCDEKHRGDIYSYKSCVKQAKNLKNINFSCKSFFDIDLCNFNNYVIYLDPPYRNTLSYRISDFDYDLFYQKVRELSKNNIVLISEYNMPDDFTVIWEKETSVQIDSLRKNSDLKNKRMEKLFIYNNK